MLYTKHIIVFSLGNNFPIVLSVGEHYGRTVLSGEDNNITVVYLSGWVIVV
jgi:hypothetical protein